MVLAYVFQLTCGCDGGAGGGLTAPGLPGCGGAESARAMKGVKLVKANAIASSSFILCNLIDP
jgi:hypothetical protein